MHVNLITYQFLVSLALKHFAFGSFLIESGIWLQRWLARKTKVFVPYFEPMTLGKLSRLTIRRLQYWFFCVKILFIKIGFSPLVVLYASVSRVIMFLMWMVVLFFSSTSLSRFKFGPLYTIRRAFFGFDLFCFVVFYYRTYRQGNNSWTEIRYRSYIKFSLAINLIYF